MKLSTFGGAATDTHPCFTSASLDLGSSVCRPVEMSKLSLKTDMVGTFFGWQLAFGSLLRFRRPRKLMTFGSALVVLHVLLLLPTTAKLMVIAAFEIFFQNQSVPGQRFLSACKRQLRPSTCHPMSSKRPQLSSPSSQTHGPNVFRQPGAGPTITDKTHLHHRERTSWPGVVLRMVDHPDKSKSYLCIGIPIRWLPPSSFFLTSKLFSCSVLSIHSFFQPLYLNCRPVRYNLKALAASITFYQNPHIRF